MPTETCCFCFERRAGVIILATLSLLGNISNTVKEFKTDRDWESIAFNVIFGTAAILLLIGVIQERYRLFTPYLIIQGVGVLFTIIAVVVVTIILLTNEHYGFEWGDLIAPLIILGFEIYFFYVVYNFYNDISTKLPR